MFDLENHLQEHAFYFKKYTDITKDDLHFNFSFLDLQFLEKDTEQTLKEFIKVLREPSVHSVKNGVRHNKKSDVHKKTKRKINLSKDIKIEAIHLKGPYGEDTMPHIHIMANKNSRWGKNYSLLKKHISEVSKQFDLLANFDTPVDYNPLAIKQLSKAVNKATWRWKQCNQVQLKKSIENKSLKRELDLLQVYTLQTHNLSYYVKSMNQIQSRLNRSKSIFVWEGHTLGDTYPLPFTQEDIAVIDLIRNRKFQQKDIKPYVNNPILRDYVRYTENLTEPVILNAIKKQTDLLKGIRKNSTATKSYLIIMKKTPFLRVNDIDYSTKTVSARHIINKDILQALKTALTSAISTKILISLMHNAGYLDFQFIKTKQKVTGCQYSGGNKTFTIKLNDIGTSWKKIQNSIKDNLFKLALGEELSYLPIIKHISLSDLIEDIKPNPIPTLEPIDYKTQEIKRKKEKASSKEKENREDEKKYQRKISELEFKIRGLERKTEKVNTGIQQLPRIRTELESCKDDITKARTRESELNSEIREFEKIIETANTGIQQVSGIKTELEQCKADIDKARTKESELSSGIKGLKNGDYEKYLVNKLRDNIESIEREIGTIESEKQELKIPSLLSSSEDDIIITLPIAPKN